MDSAEIKFYLLRVNPDNIGVEAVSSTQSTELSKLHTAISRGKQNKSAWEPWEVFQTCQEAKITHHKRKQNKYCSLLKKQAGSGSSFRIGLIMDHGK